MAVQRDAWKFTPRHLRFGVLVLLLGALVTAGAMGIWLVYRGERQAEMSAGPPRAIIVDQLSLSYPNRQFVDQAKLILTRSGYEVDYVPGEEVTVDFYRDLPRRDYDLLIFRVHSVLMPPPDRPDLPASEASLFTSEIYDARKHIGWQVDRRLISAWQQNFPEQKFFGIRPDFVRYTMEGELDGATVVLMGCDGMAAYDLALAFFSRGAKEVIGWTDLVLDFHTDRATEVLLSHLSGGASAEQAVELTMNDVGPGPAYGAKLVVLDRDEISVR